MADIKPPREAKLVVQEQTLPGDPASTEDELPKLGIPDLCIHDGDSWCVIVESKLALTLDRNQLRRHLRTARRRGFRRRDAREKFDADSAAFAVRTKPKQKRARHDRKNSL